MRFREKKKSREDSGTKTKGEAASSNKNKKKEGLKTMAKRHTVKKKTKPGKQAQRIRLRKQFPSNFALCPARIFCWTDTPGYNLCIKLICPPPDKKQQDN